MKNLFKKTLKNSLHDRTKSATGRPEIDSKLLTTNDGDEARGLTTENAKTPDEYTEENEIRTYREEHDTSNFSDILLAKAFSPAGYK